MIDGSTQSEATGREEPLVWLERVLPRTMRQFVDADRLDLTLLQLPLAQLRLAQALYEAMETCGTTGETMTRLSDQLGVKSNALTQAADRLIQRGFAERIADPSDRRLVRLRLSAHGVRCVQERRMLRRERYARLWMHLNEAEREKFVNAVRFLESVSLRLERVDGNLLPRNAATTVAHSEHPNSLDGS